MERAFSPNNEGDISVGGTWRVKSQMGSSCSHALLMLVSAERRIQTTGSDGYYRRLLGYMVGLLDQKRASDASYLEETTSHAG